jgi:hypothetical protein
VSDSNVIKLTQPGAFSDSLTEILRNGARAAAGPGHQSGGCRVSRKGRSGGVEHHHDTPPYPVMPSPNSDHSSPAPTRPSKNRHESGWTRVVWLPEE